VSIRAILNKCWLRKSAGSGAALDLVYGDLKEEADVITVSGQRHGKRKSMNASRLLRLL